MNMKPKTARRLMLLSVVVVLVVAAAAALFGVRRWQRDRYTARLRADGLALADQGAYYDALQKLGPYLRRRADDPRAMLAYAKSRELVEEANGSNLTQAIGWYQRALALDQSDRQTQVHLLTLFDQVGYFNEARDLAARLRPARLEDARVEDLEILRQEAIARIGLGAVDAKPGEPTLADIIDRAIALAPDDFNCHLLKVLWLREAKRPADAAACADKAVGDYPNDARFRLLPVVAMTDVSSSADAARIFRTLCEIAGLDPDTAERTAPAGYTDADFAVRLTHALDALSRHNHALAVLRDASQRLDDPDLFRLFIRRDWQSGRPAEVLDRLAAVRPSSTTGDAGGQAPTSEGGGVVGAAPGEGMHSELLAFKALALRDLGRSAEAAPIVQTLKGRPGDFRARGWALALGSLTEVPSDGALAQLKAMQTAIKEIPNEPVLLYFLGQALAALDRREEARTAWGSAAASPWGVGWAVPVVRTAETLLDEGRVEEGFKAAEAGARIAPTSIAANITLRAAEVAKVEGGFVTPQQQEAMLKGLEDQAKRFDQLTDKALAGRLLQILLPGRVLLDARTGHANDARALVSAALQQQPPLGPDSLLHLALICAREKLGLEDDCLDAAEKAQGPAPALALARAMFLHGAGKTARGLELLHSAAQHAPKDREAEWQVALARYLDATADPGALANWIVLADAHPDDLAIQIAALRAPASGGDLAFIERVSGRVARLTAADDAKPSIVSRLARARALIRAAPSARSRDEAVAILRGITIDAPDLMEARTLLVQALLLDDPAHVVKPDLLGAIEQLRAAAAIASDKAPISLQIAQLFQRQQDYERARAELERVANDAAASPAARDTAVDMLIRQRDFASAAAALKEIVRVAGEAAPPAMLLRLAAVQTAIRQDAEALLLYQRLAAHPPDDPEQVLQIADGLATQGDKPRASSVLNGLDRLDLPPGRKQLLLARYAERHDDAAEASAQFDRAAELAPDDPQVWNQVIRFRLARGDKAGAQDALNRALARLPNDLDLLVVKQQMLVDASPASAGDLAALVEALAANPSTRDRAEVVRAVEQVRVAGQLSDPKALSDLAARFPDEPSLQTLVVRLLMQMQPRRLREASDIIQRAMRASPTAVEPARLAVAVFRWQGKWAEMLSAARVWQLLSRSPDADLAVAESLLGLGQPRQAMEAIAPYLAAGRLDPATPVGLEALNLQARSLIALGREQDAFVLLSPFLARSADLRTRVWLPLAATLLSQPSDARTWIEQVQPLLAADSIDEQLALAEALRTLAGRFPKDAKDFLAKAVAVLKPLADGKGTASAPVFGALGLTLRMAGDAPGAVAAYRGALAADPKSVSVLLELADLLLSSPDSDPTEALGLARRAAEASAAASPVAMTFVGRAHQALARQLASKGDSAGARESLKQGADAFGKAFQANPSDFVAALGLAQASEALGDYRTAVSTYEQILAADPLPPQIPKAAIQNNLAFALFRLGRTGLDLDRARDLVQDAIAAGESASFYDTLGTIQAARGDSAAAAEAFRKALALDPGLVSSKVGWAELLVRGPDADKEQAARLLAEVSAVVAKGGQIEPSLQQRLDGVRKALHPGQP